MAGGKKIGRPKKLTQSVRIALLIPAEMLPRIEAYAARLLPGAGLCRADALRALLVAGLAAVEAKEER